MAFPIDSFLRLVEKYGTYPCCDWDVPLVEFNEPVHLRSRGTLCVIAHLGGSSDWVGTSGKDRGGTTRQFMKLVLTATCVHPRFVMTPGTTEPKISWLAMRI